jgi:hypothetical protein
LGAASTELGVFVDFQSKIYSSADTFRYQYGAALNYYSVAKDYYECSEPAMVGTTTRYHGFLGVM